MLYFSYNQKVNIDPSDVDNEFLQIITHDIK